jgi:hypothetical protein
MRRLGIAIGAFVALAATSALAQSVTSVTGSGSSVFNGGSPVSGAGSASSGLAQTSFNAYAITDQPVITFESSNQVAGAFNAGAITTSTSSVNIGISGNQSGFQFQSAITAAGLGMYAADDTSGQFGCVQFGSCTQAASSFTFKDLVPGQVATPPIGSDTSVIGYAYFDFTVQGFDGTSLTTLYSLDGLLELQQFAGQPATAQILPIVSSTGNLNQSVNSLDDLNNFRVVENTGNSYGVAWDATPFSFNVGGGIQNLIYTSKVTTYSSGHCNGSTCLVSYGAFGDPIGRGGVSIESAFSAFSFASFAVQADESTGGISGITGSPTTFNRPRFVNGALVFNAVPEPATWMSLIMGFGLLGAAMRRRRVLARA